MKIICNTCGKYQTNCYIVSKNGLDLIMDPGESAYEFVIKNAANPVAILNTHGHFDHIFSNFGLKKFFNIDVFIHKEDKFMLENDVFRYGYKTVDDAIGIGGAKFEDVHFKIGDFDVTFLHFPGHTPGTCMIKVDDAIFSGDFIFMDSIGRYDFPFSEKHSMKLSLERCMKIDGDFILYPGHGEKTTLKYEQKNMGYWIDMIDGGGY